MTKQNKVTVGVVGLGYWGPNLARNFAGLEECELAWCCDRDQAVLDRYSTTFPAARFTRELGDLLSDPSLDAIVVATPVPTHASVALQVLKAGKHCLVEKPLAHSVIAAEELVAAAQAADVELMAGHLLEYHPGVVKLKEIVNSGELGEVRYIYSNRLNLGRLRSDENALWSLGAHDISVVLSLVGEEPLELVAHGESYMNEGVEDVVFGFIRFPSGVVAHLHLSWLDPHKERRLTVVGAQQMATFDDMELERKLTIYDKGFDQVSASYGEYITRAGGIHSPRIDNTEPLKLECQHFIECVREGLEPVSNGVNGLKVVRVLEGLERSLKTGEVVRYEPANPLC